MENEELHASHASPVQQSRETEADETRVSDEDENERAKAQDSNTLDEHAPRRPLSTQDELVQNPEEVLRAVQVLNAAAVSEQWSGLLPSPNDWNQYPPQAQQKMIEWNDALIIKESERQDRLTDAEIEQGKNGQNLSALIMLFFGFLSFIAFIVTKSPYAWGLLAIPVVAYISNLFAPVASKSSRDKSQQN